MLSCFWLVQKIIGRVSDSELVTLYSKAKCFIFPSLYEGFGIPPIEAQACGCPCIVSNAASLPEVCADSAIYFDPYDVADITKKINYLLSNKLLQGNLSKKGLVNIKRFSWASSAKNLYQIIDEL